MKWYTPEDNPSPKTPKPTKTAKQQKQADVRSIAAGAEPAVLDALARLQSEVNKIRHIGKQRNPQSASTSLWRAADVALTALSKLLGKSEGVTQRDPAPTPNPAEYLSTTPASSRRQVKTANDDQGNMVKCPGCDEFVHKGEMDPTGRCEKCQREDEAAYASRGRRTKVAMKCQDCGEEVDKVDAHGDCESCQKQAELDEPATAARADGHWKAARTKHDPMGNITGAETCKACGNMSRKAPGDPDDGGLCPHCGTSGELGAFESSSEQLGEMLRGREQAKAPAGPVPTRSPSIRVLPVQSLSSFRSSETYTPLNNASKACQPRTDGICRFF